MPHWGESPIKELIDIETLKKVYVDCSKPFQRQLDEERLERMHMFMKSEMNFEIDGLEIDLEGLDCSHAFTFREFLKRIHPETLDRLIYLTRMDHEIQGDGFQKYSKVMLNFRG
jgi:hypothetical protein